MCGPVVLWVKTLLWKICSRFWAAPYVRKSLNRSGGGWELSILSPELLKSAGVDLNFIVERVAALLDMSVEDVWREGKFKHLVRARSLLCFWAVRALGLSMVSMARRLNISTVAVSKSVVRGADIAKKEGFELL